VQLKEQLITLFIVESDNVIKISGI